MLEHQAEAKAKGFHIGSITPKPTELEKTTQVMYKALDAYMRLSVPAEIGELVFDVLLDAAMADAK